MPPSRMLELQLRSLSTQLLTVHEDERRSLSRDLHDELGQMVTSMSLDLQRAGQGGDLVRKNELIGRALRGAEAMLDRARARLPDLARWLEENARELLERT